MFHSQELVFFAGCAKLLINISLLSFLLIDLNITTLFGLKRVKLIPLSIDKAGIDKMSQSVKGHSQSC